MHRRSLLAMLGLAVVATSLSPASADTSQMTSLFVTSFDGTQIDLNVCRPAGASADAPVPIVLSSHGWTGQKSSCLNRTTFFDAGIGFASMTQRGHGASGGEANVMDPTFEGRDIMAVIDHLASLDWVLKEDGPGGTDPVLGGLGGSYGGGFQWVGAFTDQLLRDAPTRFDALRPGNTWYDLRTALAPNDVLRTLIVGGLYAGGVQGARLAPWLHVAMGSIIGTGRVIDGPAPLNIGEEIHAHSAAWFAEDLGMRLDIPVLINQGAADIVFNFNEGIHAFERALTPEARARSIIVNHHAGHDLPANAPTGPAPVPVDVPIPTGPLPYTPRSESTCNTPSELSWFKHTLLGAPLTIEPNIRLRTVTGSCLGLDAWPDETVTPVAGFDGAVLPIGARGDVRLEVLGVGPMTVAGIPSLRLTAATTDPDARLFWGLAVGTSLEDARLIDQQWMPTRIAGPIFDLTVTSELGAIVASIPEGQTLFLAVAPAVDQFAAHASRSAGVVLVDDVSVHLPLI